MLNGVHIDDKQNIQKSSSGKQIQRGGQEIESEEEIPQNEYSEEDQDDEIRNLDNEMEKQLQQYNVERQEEDQDEDEEEFEDAPDGQNEIEEYGEEEEEEDEIDEDGPFIDLNKIKDQDKFMLMKYFQDQYDNNPDQLPMPKEEIEEILRENQGFIQKMQQQQDQQEYGGEGEEEEDDNEEEGMDIHEQGIDSSEIIVEHSVEDQDGINQEEEMMNLINI